MPAIQKNIEYTNQNLASTSGSFAEPPRKPVENSWSHLANTNPFVLLAVAVSVLCVLSVICLYIWSVFAKKRRKEAQLMSLFPNGLTNPNLRGVRVDQPIEFVVPTITLSASGGTTASPYVSATEDSVSCYSDSECVTTASGYSSGLEGAVPGGAKRSRHHIDPSEIRKGLYEAASDGGASKANFVLHYSFFRQQLMVTLLSAKHLLAKKGTVNPFAKVSLLPDKAVKFLTKIQKSTPNPVFNEMFIFPVKKSLLDERVLKISFWTADSFSKKVFLGQCLYPLKSCGIHSEITTDVVSEDIWQRLSSQRYLHNCEVLVSLTYQPDASTLTLGIMKVRNLDVNEVNLVYVKVSLYLQKKRIRSRKTQVRKAVQEVEFGDSFHVQVAQSSLKDVEMTVTVYGKSNALSNKQILGKTRVGERCQNRQGVEHWQDMVGNLTSTTNHWHQLGSPN